MLSRCSLATPVCPQKSDRAVTWISFGLSQKINSSCTGLTEAFNPGEQGEYLQEGGWEAFQYVGACGQPAFLAPVVGTHFGAGAVVLRDIINIMGCGVRGLG